MCSCDDGYLLGADERSCEGNNITQCAHIYVYAHMNFGGGVCYSKLYCMVCAPYLLLICLLMLHSTGAKRHIAL